MQKILNFRTLAKGMKNKDGKEIKANKIFRSAGLSHASTSDIEDLKSNNILYVYDLRSSNEMKHAKMLEADGIKVVNYDIIKHNADQNDMRKLGSITPELVDKFMIQLYENDLYNSDEYKILLEALLNQDSDEFLFHCTAGKDRTGVLSAILMMILDFDYESIVKEYLLIDNNLKEFLLQVTAKSMEIPREELEKLDGIYLVKDIYIQSYLDKILSKYNDFDAFLEQKLGIDNHKKQLFQAKYL